MGRLEYKILKNMPSYNSYSQYYYDDDEDLSDFYDNSGVRTIIKSDDIYTRVTEEGTDNNDMADWRPISHLYVGTPANINHMNNVFLQRYYEFGSNEYLRTSAPNLVHLFFDLS